jgi:catechol-2,3-dioxygenase
MPQMGGMPQMGQPAYGGMGQQHHQMGVNQFGSPQQQQQQQQNNPFL